MGEGSWTAAFSLFLEGPRSTSTGVHFHAWEGLEDKQGTANTDLLRAHGQSDRSAHLWRPPPTKLCEIQTGTSTDQETVLGSMKAKARWDRALQILARSASYVPKSLIHKQDRTEVIPVQGVGGTLPKEELVTWLINGNEDSEL